jgi:hypothetical protein
MVLNEHFFELLFSEYFNALWTEFGPLERLCDKAIPWRSSEAAPEATHFILLVCSDLDSTPNVELFIGVETDVTSRGTGLTGTQCRVSVPLVLYN